MSFYWLICALSVLLARPGNSSVLRAPALTKEYAPEGPPRPVASRLTRTSEPLAPSLHGLDLLRPPAPPKDGPRPPAAPDPHLLAIFEKDPDNFPTAFSAFQQQNKRDKRTIATKKRDPSYDQFITTAVVTGLGLQRSVYTMFAPSDAYWRSINITLPFLALQDMNCARQIVQSHVVLGRVSLADGVEDVALSLQEMPIFFSAKEVNGVSVARANIPADYGLVHIINGLMDRQRVIDSCPSLQRRLSAADEGRQDALQPAASSVSLSKVADASIKANDIAVAVPYSAGAETNVPLELLVNIDDFANAVQLAWQTDDSVIAVLQELGASTLMALLERSHMMHTLTTPGPWTVFAPDNAAWQALPKETFDHIMNDQALLRQILSYHIVQANATRRQLVNNQRLSSTHQGHPVHVNFYTDGWASWYTASGSQITDLDEMASNGVVHVVRSVLFPPLADLYSTVKWTPALQTAFSMLQSTDDPAFSNSSAVLTAFLPADSPALEASLAGLDASALAAVLRRHVVRGTWFVSGLIDGDQLFTFGGEVLAVSHDGDCVGINGACVVVRDITLTNGVLHVVDKLIPSL